MKKILLSWYAFNNDFFKGENGMEVNPEGPTVAFHRHFYGGEGYEKQILLSSARKVEDDLRLLRLQTYLRQHYPDHALDMMAMDIKDPINLQEILAKVNDLLEQLRDNEIDIFISPGTPAMQTAWTLLHLNKNLSTRLIQTRSARDARSDKPQLSYVEIEKSDYTSAVAIRESFIDKKDPYYLVTQSIRPLMDKARKVAATNKATVLIMGPSGSGKEYLAQFIHDESARRDYPYLAINCAGFSDTLLQSELFGHEKGAFTGADKKKEGIIQKADGGTLFLDEIGDISPLMQQALLRVLQEGEIQPVGSTEIISVDVRFIAATNADLISKCQEGAFRWDLFYRLAVVDLHIPSLRERGLAELKEYLEYFIKKKAAKFRRPKLELDTEVKRIVLSYSFPGNLRELENLVERLYVLAEDGIATKEHLSPWVLHPPVSQSLLWEDVEKAHIERVLRKNNYNQKRTKEDIGYGAINTLRKKIKDYGIEVVR